MSRVSTGPKSRIAAENGNSNGQLVDRASTLLDHADDADDTVCFWEGDLITNRFKYIERVDVPDVRALGIEEFISQRYGGGKYKAGIRQRSNGAFRSSVVVEIVGPPKSRTDRDAARGLLQPTTSTPAGGRAGELPTWLEKILLPIGVTAATAFGTYLAKKMLEPKPSDPVLIELLKQLGKKDANAGAAPAGSPLDQVKLLQSLLELQDSLAERANPGGGSAPAGDRGARGVAGVLERQLPGFVNLLNRKIDMEERRAVRSASPVPASPAASLATSSSSAQAPADPLVALLLEVPPIARQFILSAAESDENPAVYADLILGKLDDESYTALATCLERAEFVDVFCQTMPAFGEFRPWVAELAAAMRDSIATAVPAELGGTDAGLEGAPSHSGDAAPVDAKADT